MIDVDLRMRVHVQRSLNGREIAFSLFTFMFVCALHVLDLPFCCLNGCRCSNRKYNILTIRDKFRCRNSWYFRCVLLLLERRTQENNGYSALCNFSVTDTCCCFTNCTKTNERYTEHGVIAFPAIIHIVHSMHLHIVTWPNFSISFTVNKSCGANPS